MKKLTTLAAAASLLLASPAQAHETTKERVVREHAGRHAVSSVPTPADGVWFRLAKCESGLRNVSRGRYRGYLQFDRRTWQANGGTGQANEHPWREQLRVAKVLQSRRGWKPWPACSRKLGLRR